MEANLKNFIYHCVTKFCSYILFLFWVERKAWTERSHRASTLYPLEVCSYCGKKKKLFWVLKVLENLLLPLIKWSEGWQLPQRAQQPFPSSCLCLILLCGSGSCFQVVPYPTSQLDPVWLTWLPQVWRGWEWDNSRGISRFGLTWRPGKAARSLSRSSVRSTLLLARGLGLQFDYVLQQIL